MVARLYLLVGLAGCVDPAGPDTARLYIENETGGLLSVTIQPEPHSIILDVGEITQHDVTPGCHTIRAARGVSDQWTAEVEACPTRSRPALVRFES